MSLRIFIFFAAFGLFLGFSEVALAQGCVEKSGREICVDCVGAGDERDIQECIREVASSGWYNEDCEPYLSEDDCLASYVNGYGTGDTIGRKIARGKDWNEIPRRRAIEVAKVKVALGVGNVRDPFVSETTIPAASPKPTPTPKPSKKQSPPVPEDNSKKQADPRDTEPVLLYTGEFVFDRNDLTAPGFNESLTWRRTYRSQLNYDGPLGGGWTHSFNQFITLQAAGASFFGEGGSVQFFPKSTGNSYQTPPGTLAKLEPAANANQFILTYSDGTKKTFGPTTNANGQILLTAIADRPGNRTLLRYQNDRGNVRLAEIEGPLGPGFKITIEYEEDWGKIHKVSSGAQSVVYEYIHILESDSPPALWHATTTPAPGATAGTKESYTYDRGHYSARAAPPTLVEVQRACTDVCNEQIEEACSNACSGGDLCAGCEEACNEGCGRACTGNPECSEACYGVDSCIDDCEMGCQDACPEACGENCGESCEGDACESECVADLGRSEPALCKNTCVAQFRAYGIPSDLNYNLTEIRDTNGVLYLKNDYGTDVHSFSFDRVVKQQWGEPDQILSIAYADYDDAGNLTVNITDRKGFRSSYRYQGSNLVKKTVVPGAGPSSAPSVERYTYNSNHLIETYTSPLGIVSKMDYDAANTAPLKQGNILKITVTPTSGSSLPPQITQFTYDPATNQIASVASARGNQTTFHYDEKGDLIKTVQPGGNIRQLAYNARHQLIRSIDPNGNETRYFYNSLSSPTSGPACGSAGSEEGGLLRAVQYGTLWECYGYNANGDMVYYRDGEQREWRLEKDDRNRIQKMTGPMGFEAHYTFDPYDKLVSSRRKTLDPQSMLGEFKEQRMTYDLLSNLKTIATEIREGVFHTVMLGYDKDENLQSISDHHGVIVYDTDNRGFIWRETEGVNGPGQGQRIMTHDPQGNLTKITDANDETRSTYTYDGFGRLSSGTDVDGVRHNYAYDSDSRPVKHEWSYTDYYGKPKKGETVYEYNANGWVTSVTNRPLSPSGSDAVTRYDYDLNGNITKITLPNQTQRTFSYNARNQILTSSSFPDGSHKSETIYTYNAKNKLTSMRQNQWDETGGGNISRTHEYGYDELGRVNRVATPDGLATRYTWNGLNEQIRTDYPNNEFESMARDGLGRPVSWNRGTNSFQLRWAWNDNDRSVTQTDGIGGSIIHNFDDRGRLVKASRPSAGQTGAKSYAYDKESNITGWTDFEGNQVTQAVNPAGQVISRRVARSGNTVGTTVQNFGYAGGFLYFAFDNNNPDTPDDDITARLDYDAFGALSGDNINGSATTATRDPMGLINTLTNSTGRSVALQYDKIGRLTAVKQAAQTLFQYQYSGDGLGAVLFNKTQDRILYRPTGEVDSIAIQPNSPAPSPITTLNFKTYNRLGAPERIEGVQKDGGLSTNFSITNRHDGIGQLLSTNILADPAAVSQKVIPKEWAGFFEYGYDNNANRRTASYLGTMPGQQRQTADYSTDSLSSQYSKVGGQDVKYDLNGNMIEKGGKFFRYDFLGRLKKVEEMKPSLTSVPLPSEKGPNVMGGGGP